MSNPIGIFLFKGCDSSLCAESYAVLLRSVKAIEKAIVSNVNIREELEINVVIADGRTMRGLNKRFRNIDSSTDVLAFPLGEDLDGEIWLCPSVIYKNAKKFGECFDDELVRVLVHGLLHLLGYDHKEKFISCEKSREKMFILQEKIVLNVLG